MINSGERMDYICGYLASYENKIRMANKQGLFDAAKMFEVFAAQVCSLWFGQPFKNLNVEVSNYPYVDLISEDQELLVQVSTVQDISGKIKSTLENLRDTKDSRFSSVKNIVFFMLHNQSIDRVCDYTGDTQIGNIPFTRKDNLISTQDILSRSQNDFDFQSRLYELLKKDEFYTSSNEIKFREALSFSRNVGLKNINCFIHGEYQIDRSSLVDKVKTDDFRFISIQGGAGSGKSAFCKILLENESFVLYARAERFLEESNLNDIWSMDIEKVLTYINGKKLTFFIDALEFIADCRQTKFELLQQLYTISQRYENVYIVTSCRSSEKSAFIKLETNLEIHSYSVDELSDEELSHIAERYPVIRKMCGMKAYSSLLRIPFYIELILEKGINPDNIHDEVAFREHIWNNLVCLKERSKNYHLKYNEIVQTVEHIVFERAKHNLLGIRSDRIDSDILRALISEGVLIKQGTSVRLKYDIFEDICFERYFDEKFQECRGNYNLFYDKIGDMGRCVYRRYQIWISNKLFGAQDRAKFLHSLVFTDAIPLDWKKQTQIGIVKSKYCSTFFNEQGQNIVESGQIWDFINIANLFAFEMQLHFLPGTDPRPELYPIGNGRLALIQLIHRWELYKNSKAKQPQIVKLCQDYAKQSDIPKDAAPLACAIATHYVDEILNDCLSKDYYHFIEYASPSLTAIYQMPGAAKDWIKAFWNRLLDFYTSSDRKRVRVAEDTIQWTMRNTYPQLVSTFSKDLCALFEVFWTHTPKTYEVIELFQRQMIWSSIGAECAIDLLFNNMDFSKFTDETIEFYQSIFGSFLPEFLDSWQDPDRRHNCKRKIMYLEQKVNSIEEDHIRLEFYKLLFFFDTRNCAVDFSQCPTSYSYEDVVFLNELFSKYGKYHLHEMLQTVCQLQIEKTLPNILVSVNDCFNHAKCSSGRFSSIVSKDFIIVKTIIYKAYIKYSEEIKQDHQLTQAYENVLETLTELNYEDAAVILDDFRLY